MFAQGSDFLWAVFALMASTGIATTFWSYRLPAGQRVFHQLGSAILFTGRQMTMDDFSQSYIVVYLATIAYFSMASDLGKYSGQNLIIRSCTNINGLIGSTPVAVEFVRQKSYLYSEGNIIDPYRSIWYAR